MRFVEKYSLSLLVMLLVSLDMLAQRHYVLVTGVSSYKDADMNVTQTTKNAKSFAVKMKTQTPDVSVLTSKYANHDNVLAKLKRICRAAKPEDRITFYFAGHGGVDEKSGTGYICSYDDPILYAELMECFKLSKAKEKIMFVEACHSGSAGGALKSFIDPSVICISSSRMSEASIYSNLIDAGYFSKGLLVGLQGKADMDKDKLITLSELFKYLYGYVIGKSNNKQHPQLIMPKTTKDIVFFDCNKL